MRNSTPFFVAFAPLLFGRPPRSFRTALRQSVPKADSLSQWRAAFASMIPDALLAPEKKGAGSRERLFSPLVTFWAFLSQVLSPNSACREAVRKVQAWWMLHSPVEMSPDTSAYCQARQRLSDQVLLSIHSHLAERMEANASSESRWLSREVKIVDGTCLSMPDTPENQAAYPQPSNQKKGCGFPMMKLVGLFSLKSAALLHFARGTLRVHESQLFRQLWAHLSEGDIVLGDRGFCSFFAMASLLGRGVGPSRQERGTAAPRNHPVSPEHRPCSGHTQMRPRPSRQSKRNSATRGSSLASAFYAFPNAETDTCDVCW